MDDHVERTDCHAGADEVDFVRPAAPSSVPNSDFIKPAARKKHSDAPDQAVSEDQPPNAEEEPQQEELDPRVQAELERLNKCTDEINQLELQLEEAQSVFRTLLTDSTQQLKATAARIGSAIDKARPYYEALEVAQKAQKECQSAATHYQVASGVHAAAKETIALAEERFLTNSNDWSFDNAWQEMLNHATMKVMQAEKDKTDSEAEHARRAQAFTKAEQEVSQLEKKLKKFIQKSRPYFEEKDAFNRALESQKSCVHRYQGQVKAVKADYARCLRALEEISESIHERRRSRKMLLTAALEGAVRQPGVGSETRGHRLTSQTSLGGASSLDFDLDAIRAPTVDGASSTDTDVDVRSVSGASSSIHSTSRSHSVSNNPSMDLESLTEDMATKLDRTSLHSHGGDK